MTLLAIRGLVKRFSSVEVLRGVDLDVTEGETVSIIGSSGSGKSTLLRCVNLLEDFDGGEILLAGIAMGYAQHAGARRRLGERVRARQRAMTGMVFQSFNLFPHLTAMGNVTLGLVRVLGLSHEVARSRALDWLDRVGLADRAGHLPGQLSGGQQQRVAIARALAMSPKLLLLDEITSALDPELVGEVLGTIRSLAKEGTTMLIVTHEMAFAREVSNRVVFMAGGRIAEQGRPEEIFLNAQSTRLREFLGKANIREIQE
jgi:polar amino acid transport system ATP-binding protein